MNTIILKKLYECPELCNKAACWFSKKWGIPIEAYKESIQECIKLKTEIPQWYLVLDNQGEIAAGAGIIENDFHDRKDLSPNLCALFVEEKYRKQGIAKYILDSARKEIGNMGYESLYLVTDHTEFYERCGWKFYTMVNGDDGNTERLYTTSALH